MEEEMKAQVTETEVQETAGAAAQETAETAAQETVETAAQETVAEAAQETAETAAQETVETVAEEAAGAAGSEAAEKEPVKAEEPTESMADYEAEIDASLRRYERGEKVKCTVVSVDTDKIMVELGSTAGVISKKDASDDPSYNLQENVKPGDEVEATVIRPDDGHGNVVLSMKAAAAAKAWDRLANLLTSKEPVSVKITATTKAGVITMLEGVRAFIPKSKLDSHPVADEDLKDWVGKTVDVHVITAEKDGRKLVLSAKELLKEKAAAEKKEAISQVKVGMVTEGTVETIKDYGAFVNIGNGVTGLLHVSQISQKRIKTPAEVLKEKQVVKVKVTKVADGRVSLSMKALEDNGPASEEREEKVTYKLPKSEAIGTSFGDLLKGIKLN